MAAARAGGGAAEGVQVVTLGRAHIMCPVWKPEQEIQTEEESESSSKQAGVIHHSDRLSAVCL